MPKKEKCIIIDGNALLHRAFHAMPPLTTRDGQLVNAVYGFTTILMRVMKDLTPRYIAVTFDLAAPTFRHEEYDDYKAHREKAPDELYAQLDPIKDVVEAFAIPIYEIEGFEADDVIGTVSKQLDKHEGVETYIVTGDLDTLQLVDHNTFVYTPKRSISEVMIYDEPAVVEKYKGLKPNQLIDYKALRGDPSDNIPGVRGIGEKTAIELLNKYGTLKELYKKYKTARSITPRIKGLLEEHKEDAFLSQRLATIVTDVPIDFALEDCEFQGVDREALIPLFQELEFKTLLGKIPELEKKLKVAPKSDASQSKVKKTNGTSYELIDSEAALKKFLTQLAKKKLFAFDTETSDLDPWQSKLVGLSFSWKAGEAYYLDWQSIKDAPSLKKLEAVMSDPKVGKIGHNIKFDIESLLHAGIATRGAAFDTMIAAYLLNPGARQLKLDTLVFSEFGHQMIPIEDLIGKKGKNQLSMIDLGADRIVEYASEDADYTWRLYEVLKKEVKSHDCEELLDSIEMKLISVLVNMEAAGVKIDESYLDNFHKKLAKDIALIEKKIYELAGQEFNIASPKQLKEILFEKLDIPTEGLKKTKTGISTAASELEKMRGLHPIIDLISDFRELTKLQSTYIEALPKLINPETGRVHTSFNQTIAATGRLSSSDPNLQNIPIRTELGRKIRNAFIAEKGNVLLAADYSQIELRMIAHLSGDKNMIETFVSGGDIHTTTASFIHDVQVKDVTKEMRRSAKEINFGVLYGMGSYGLAQRTGISRSEAKQFIDKYFEQYATMKQYRESLIEQAKAEGYVKTMFDRKRYLPDINSGVAPIRQAAERAAINLPVQGSSADIMKLAMIAVDQKLQKEFPDARMLMQVHDELVFEVSEKHVKKIADMVKKEMESVAKLKVPLVVDVKVGDNWGEMEEL